MKCHQIPPKMKKTDIDLLTIHKLEINQYKESQHKYLLIQNFQLSYRKRKIHLLKNLLSLNHFSLLIENN